MASRTTETLFGSGVFRIPSKVCQPVLTYHACYDELPASIAAVDNVPAARMYEQLDFLKRQYEFVGIDEFCTARQRSGLAAVTFDDGYKSVVECGLPVLAAHGIPATVFINTIGVEQRTFWRHKVMWVIQNNLVEECEKSFTQVRKVPGKTFHAYSKHPVNSSIVVEREIDKFLESRGVQLPNLHYLIDSRSYFLPNALVSYGNHTASHYVLSSLSVDEQRHEIIDVKRFLQHQHGISISNVFAAPFGEITDVNEDTCSILRDLGYRHLLVNRGGVNRRLAKRFGITLIERFSVVNCSIGAQLTKHFFESITGRRGLFFGRP